MSAANLEAYYRIARLHQPVGNFLVYWPFAWALLMSARRVGMPPIALAERLVVYAVGSVLLRSAECVLNDICDIDIDRKVERTKSRPLASGTMTIRGASVFLTLLTSMCLSLLYLTNHNAIVAGLFGFFILDTLYPLMKRITYWPQAWLGLAINWGFIVAWLDVSGEEVNPVLLVLGMIGLFCWTVIYDTIYSCQDKIDDLKIGVKSTAILFGDRLPSILKAFGVTFIVALCVTGYLNSQGPAFFAISVLGSIAHMGWQLFTLNPSNVSNCRSRFLSNVTLGWIVAGGLLVDYASLRML